MNLSFVYGEDWAAFEKKFKPAAAWLLHRQLHNEYIYLKRLKKAKRNEWQQKRFAELDGHFKIIARYAR